MKIHAIILATVCAVIGSMKSDICQAGITTIENTIPEKWEYTWNWSNLPSNGWRYLTLRQETQAGNTIRSITSLPNSNSNWTVSEGTTTSTLRLDIGTLGPAVTQIVGDGVIDTTTGYDGRAGLTMTLDIEGIDCTNTRITGYLALRKKDSQMEITTVYGKPGICSMTAELNTRDTGEVSINYADQITLKRLDDKQKITSVTSRRGGESVNITWATADSSIGSATQIVGQDGTKVDYGTPVRLTLAGGDTRDWYIEQTIDLTGQSVTGNVSVTVEIL